MFSMKTNTKSVARKFRIGYYFDLFSFSFDDWKLEADTNLDLAPEHMEIMLECPGTCANFGANEAATLKSLLPGIPLSVHAPTLNYSLVTLSDLVLEASIKEHLVSLDAAQHLGAELFTLHAGTYPFHALYKGNSPEQLFRDSVVPIITKANSLGINVLVENLGGGMAFPSTFDEIDRVLALDDRLQMALDTRHFCMVGLDPLEGYLRYKDRVATIQFRMDGVLSEEYVRRFMIALFENEYDGIFIIEDKALTSVDKVDRRQLDAGRACVYAILDDLAGADLQPA
jgi:sugar phosphate isomerase/epimerase